MAKYHVNDKGNPGMCRAKFDCPFGGSDRHYDSREEAREDYEKTMRSFEEARVNPHFAERDAPKATSNSAWNKYNNLKRMMLDSAEDRLLKGETVSGVKDDLMNEFGPMELHYLASRKWPDEKVQSLAQGEIDRRKDGKFGEQPKSEPVGVSLSDPVMTVDEYGTKEWWVNGKLHRTDGPAVEGADGTKEWWVNDKRHREDGPAFEWADGTKAWWVNNKPHREDGPAVEWGNGDKEWWVNGEELSEAEFQARMGGH